MKSNTVKLCDNPNCQFHGVEVAVGENTSGPFSVSLEDVEGDVRKVESQAYINAVNGEGVRLCDVCGQAVTLAWSVVKDGLPDTPALSQDATAALLDLVNLALLGLDIGDDALQPLLLEASDYLSSMEFPKDAE